MSDRLTVARLGVVALQWALLTCALAASIMYSSPSVSGLLAPHIDGSWPFITAFVAALLLGIVIRPYPALSIGLLLMLVGAAALFAALLVAPALDGSVAWTTALRNHAINQLFVLPLVLALPTALGGMAGALLRSVLGERTELLAAATTTEIDGSRRRSWWDT